jgi:hypothetical protein
MGFSTISTFGAIGNLPWKVKLVRIVGDTNAKGKIYRTEACEINVHIVSVQTIGRILFCARVDMVREILSCGVPRAFASLRAPTGSFTWNAKRLSASEVLTNGPQTLSQPPQYCPASWTGHKIGLTECLRYSIKLLNTQAFHAPNELNTTPGDNEQPAVK